MNNKLLTIFMLLFGLMLLASCSDDPESAPPPVTLTGISISPAQVSDDLPIGVTQQFTATGSYSDNSLQDLSSSATWSSSAPATASVDGNGLATGRDVGTADITASYSGVTSNVVAVEVINPTLVSITVAPPVVTSPLPVGRSMPFTAQGVFDNSKAYDVTDFVTWDSSDQGVATIESTGVATARTDGTTDISASTAAPAVTSNIVALETAIGVQDSLTIEPHNLDPLPINRTKQLVALLEYADGTTVNVTDTAEWGSSNTDVAVVETSLQDRRGVVTGKSDGTVTITARDPSTGLEDTQTVVVNDATLVTVTITPESPADLPAGTTQAFAAQGLFSDGITRLLSGYERYQTWSVSDTDFASIEEFYDNIHDIRGGPIGLVRGEAPGDVSVEYRDVDVTGNLSGVRGSTDLTVIGGVLQSISIWPAPVWSAPADAGRLFTATGVWGGGEQKDITEEVIWTSSDRSVGVFDTATRGLLLTLPGTAGMSTVVTASMLNTDNPPVEISSPTTTLTVNNAVFAYLNISPKSPEIFAGSPAIVQLEAYAQFENPDSWFDVTERVTWSSDDEGIAKVSNAAGSKGLIYGESVGVTRIWAEDPDGNRASTEVRVK